MIGAVMARWSWVSCRQPQPLPRLAVWLTLEITSIGIESAYAWPMAVAALVTPGPVMTKHTPGLPLTRA
ncbi:hypothetical protein D3C77_565050 [compost metagenome]